MWPPLKFLLCAIIFYVGVYFALLWLAQAFIQQQFQPARISYSGFPLAWHFELQQPRWQNQILEFSADNLILHSGLADIVQYRAQARWENLAVSYQQQPVLTAFMGQAVLQWHGGQDFSLRLPPFFSQSPKYPQLGLWQNEGLILLGDNKISPDIKAALALSNIRIWGQLSLAPAIAGDVAISLQGVRPFFDYLTAVRLLTPMQAGLAEAAFRIKAGAGNNSAATLITTINLGASQTSQDASKAGLIFGH